MPADSRALEQSLERAGEVEVATAQTAIDGLRNSTELKEFLGSEHGATLLDACSRNVAPKLQDEGSEMMHGGEMRERIGDGGGSPTSSWPRLEDGGDSPGGAKPEYGKNNHLNGFHGGGLLSNGGGADA